MLTMNTPIDDHFDQFGLMVKREDLSCPPPGPPFSKTRGVFAHIKNRPEEVIGVLDTYHSQAGHAVAQACSLLGKTCINFYPDFKHEPGPRAPQHHALSLGAQLQPLKAGMSAVLYNQAKAQLRLIHDSYMMPNALKLPEMVEETAAEVQQTLISSRGSWLANAKTVLIAISSGTIAAGVIKGLHDVGHHPHFILHMGYDRSEDQVLEYVRERSGVRDAAITLVNEGYAYKQKAKPGPEPLWPCNPYYDLKAFRWWMRDGREKFGEALMWNIG
jgi:hypothetical protein